MKKVLLSLLFMITTACGNTQKESDKIRINMWTAQDSQIIKDIIQRFNNSQEKYEVVMSFKGSYAETLTAGIAAVKSKQAPHLLQVFEVGTGTMMSAENIYKSANDILTKYGNIEVDSLELIPGVQSYYSKNGKLQSFPFNSSTPVMLYNKDAFKKAGIDINNLPQTFEEFEVTVLQKLKNAGYVPMTSTWGSYVLVETLSSIHNTPFATYNNGLDNQNKARLKLSGLHLKTFEYLKNLSDKGLYIYYGRNDAGATPFLQQEVAIMFGSSSSQNSLKQAGIEYGVAPIPYFAEYTDKPYNSMVGGASLWAFNGFSDDIYTGIAEFMKFIYSPEIMFEYHDVTGYLPLTAGAYDLAVKEGYYIKNPTSEVPYLQFTRQDGENSKGWRLGNFVQIRIAYEEVLESLFQGSITPEQAVEIYTQKSDQLLETFENAN